jgi:hypothetical protein
MLVCVLPDVSVCVLPDVSVCVLPDVSVCVLQDVSVSELKKMWEESDDKKKRELQRQLSFKADSKSGATSSEQQQVSKTTPPSLHGASQSARKPTSTLTTNVKTDSKGVPTVRVDPLKRTHSTNEKSALPPSGASSSANRKSLPVSHSQSVVPRADASDGSMPKVSELKTKFQQQHNIRRVSWAIPPIFDASIIALFSCCTILLVSRMSM